MLNLNTYAQESLNTITINGIDIARLNDVDAQRVLDVINGLVSTRNTTTARVSAPAPAPSPATPTVYDHVETGFDVVWTCKDNGVTFTYPDGSYVGATTHRTACKNVIKAHGGTWDANAKQWVFVKNGKRDIKGAKDFVASAPKSISADELNAIRDKWTAKSAKKAGKKA